MSKLLYKIDYSFAVSLIAALVAFFVIIIIFYFISIPLGIISSLLFGFCLYRIFRKLPVSISLFDDLIELKYLNFNKFIKQKIAIDKIVEVNAFYAITHAISLNIRTGETEAHFDLGEPSDMQIQELHNFLKQIVLLDASTKLRSAEPDRIVQRNLQRVGLTGRMIKSKSGISIYKLSK